MSNYTVELFRGGDIKSLGSYTLAGAYRAFATCIRLVESGEYDSVCIFAWMMVYPAIQLPSLMTVTLTNNIATLPILPSGQR